MGKGAPKTKEQIAAQDEARALRKAGREPPVEIVEPEKEGFLEKIANKVTKKRKKKAKKGEDDAGSES